MISKKAKLETAPYKGVRDFFPEDQALQNYIFSIWRKVVESYGYQEYSASILEPTELYRAKSGDEIVQNQTYSFIDRGGRDVTLRPEMTPTVARMVSQRKRELSFPLRWYSIPNLFRYENPQRGRLREHWQLNVDLFGINGTEAEVEVISIASEIMKGFGARDEDFEIRLNSRKIMNYILKVVFELGEEEQALISRLIDRKDKIEESDFRKEAEKVMRDRTDALIHILNSNDLNLVISNLKTSEEEVSGWKEIRDLQAELANLGIKNIVFSPTLIRGFDYYTGIVFEIFDKNPKNKRSIFGGGRFDDLLSLFGDEMVPGVGFGLGDVTMRDFLETHGLIRSFSSNVNMCVAVIGKKNIEKANELAQFLRKEGYNVIVDSTERKIGDKIKQIERQKIPFVIFLGEEEAQTGKFRIKNISTREEQIGTKEEIKEIVR